MGLVPRAPVCSRTGQKELHFYAADGPERNDWVTVINQQSGYLCEDGWTDFIEEQVGACACV